MNLETAVSFAGTVAEAVIVGLLIYRRVWRTLPFFCIYSLNCVLGSLSFLILGHHFTAKSAFETYFYESLLDFTLQFCVLVEVAWSVFRPFRPSLPHGTVWVLAVVIAAAGFAIWPFTTAIAPAHTGMVAQWILFERLQQTVSILRILFFLILASCSQLLSIGWKDRELQVATGLGFYSLMSLLVTVWHSHQTTEAQYISLEGLVASTYLCSLLYWVYSFAQKEVERREFSPQMQSMLLAVAGAARSTRIALDPGSIDSSKRRR